jgi:hypothetical protein
MGARIRAEGEAEELRLQMEVVRQVPAAAEPLARLNAAQGRTSPFRLPPPVKLTFIARVRRPFARIRISSRRRRLSSTSRARSPGRPADDEHDLARPGGCRGVGAAA